MPLPLGISMYQADVIVNSGYTQQHYYAVLDFEVYMYFNGNIFISAWVCSNAFFPRCSYSQFPYLQLIFGIFSMAFLKP